MSDALQDVLARIAKQEKEKHAQHEQDQEADRAHLKRVRELQVARLEAETAKAQVDLEASQLTLTVLRKQAKSFDTEPPKGGWGLSS